MKRLFTLVALLTMFFGAQAKEVTDFSVDFTEKGKSTLGWKGDVVDYELFTADEDGLHCVNPAKTDNNWDFQFLLLSGIGLDVDETYKMTIVAKADGNAAVNYKLGDWSGGIEGQITVGPEYQEYVIEGAAKYSSNFLMIQFGHYVGTVSFQSVTITHEENESQPVTWKNMLINGDAEGEYGEIPCAQSQEFGMHLDENGARQVHAADIETVDGSKVFAVHAKAVDPVLRWDEDGEQWGTPYSAGDPKPDNAWQNQFFIVFPRALKDGEPLKISFKYKASKNVKVSTQGHRMPGDYLDGGQLGDLTFTTDWQTIEKQFTSTAGTQSIAFNLGQEIYTEDLDFYFDDIKLEEMELETGFFVAGANASKLINYDFTNAIPFEYDEEWDAMVAVIGSENPDTWVNEIMISTVRGNDKAFQSNTLKPVGTVVNDPDGWINYTSGAKQKIKLPAAGAWKIGIDDKINQIAFVKLYGEEDKEPIEIKPNETEVVVNAVERDWKPAKTGEGVEPDTPQDGEEGIGTGQDWDNQFFIIGHRALEVGEEVVVAFDYKAEIPAKVGSQNSKNAGEYLHHVGVGQLDFTTEWQHFEKTIAIPEETKGNQNSWTFNLALMKGANKYYFKNIVFKTADDTESLIDMEGAADLWVKEGANTSAYPFGTDPDAIRNVTSKDVKTNAIYNLAGQKVNAEYKGVVVKGGNKFIVK